MALATSILTCQSIGPLSRKGRTEGRVLAFSSVGFNCAVTRSGRLWLATCVTEYSNCLKTLSDEGLQGSLWLSDFRNRGKLKRMCCISSLYQNSKPSLPRKHRKLGFSVTNFDQPLQPGTFKAHAKLQSEAYDIAEPRTDFVKFPSSSTKNNVEEGVSPTTGSVSSFLEQFPKRWMIVILCFSAFLLCNMDRVNMSIAILPMSAEFGWNPATVGLIQSSFFWGYLLTQIAGGIWADTLGGKRVLGFGVVWWSIATVLTPIAAKIGLPFLLVVRAFMGVGEVGFLLVVCSCIFLSSRLYIGFHVTFWVLDYESYP